MVSQVWQDEGEVRNVRELQNKLSSFAGHLDGWGRSTFGHVRLELSKLKRVGSSTGRSDQVGPFTCRDKSHK
jgi:hypothetical protein